MKKRNCRFEVRFTKDELSDLTKKARKARLTNAAFIRRAVCGAEVREAPPADVPALIQEVRRVGNNLNQIMKDVYKRQDQGPLHRQSPHQGEDGLGH